MTICEFNGENLWITELCGYSPRFLIPSPCSLSILLDLMGSLMKLWQALSQCSNRERCSLSNASLCPWPWPCDPLSCEQSLQHQVSGGFQCRTSLTGMSVSYPLSMPCPSTPTCRLQTRHRHGESLWDYPQQYTPLKYTGAWWNGGLWQVAVLGPITILARPPV